MGDMYLRTRLVIGEENLQKLKGSKVAIFGLGGVGGHCLDALVRAGIGHFLLVDNDVFEESNLNRQLLSLRSNIGRDKVDVAKEHVFDINPQAEVLCKKTFYTLDTRDEFEFFGYDYIVDAIDTVSGKVALIERAKMDGIPIISCMGTGNKLNPSMLQVSDIYNTSVCPLAKAVRSQLRQRNIDSLKVVFSKEEPVSNERPPGSVSFVPSVAGILMASEVIKDITDI